ncbi:hypothetical protein KAR91_18335 [Candidatus Pacearchaeota archaeon]|nr:hypothetical protein [Candidatus Pacearchaeota archaeon]
MKIETKYNVGSKIWCCDEFDCCGSKVVYGTVTNIFFEIQHSEVVVKYRVKRCCCNTRALWCEDECYGSLIKEVK